MHITATSFFACIQFHIIGDSSLLRLMADLLLMASFCNRLVYSTMRSFAGAQDDSCAWERAGGKQERFEQDFRE